MTVVPGRGTADDPWVQAVGLELAREGPAFSERTLRSIYFGGGTPSLAAPRALATLIDKVRATFAPADPVEVTLEANPDDCSERALAAWREAGINRLSVGMQTVDPEQLSWLSRRHGAALSQQAVARAAAAGFDSVSCDVISAVPTARSDRALDHSLDFAAAHVSHVSVYELTVHSRTHLGKRLREGRLRQLDDDATARQYLHSAKRLRDAGFEHYEISSFARPGHRSVHNGLYWQGADTLGLGPGATTLLTTPTGARRWSNHRSAPHYLRRSPYHTRVHLEELDSDQLAIERAWLGLRTTEGIDERLLAQRRPVVEWLLSEKLVRRQHGLLLPTEKGFLFADQVARRIHCAKPSP